MAYSCTKKIVLLSAETTSLLLSATKQIHQRSSANKSHKKVLYSHANSQQLNSCLQYMQLYMIAFLLYKTSKFLKVHKSKSFNYISPLELIIQI